MTDGDRPAVDVECVFVECEVADDRQDLRREGFVDLEAADVRKLAGGLARRRGGSGRPRRRGRREGRSR
jgi:hypothetical protein